MSTTSWLVRRSHKPSEAKIRKWSSGRIFCTLIDGSAVIIGFSKGSFILNFVNKGALLNSAFFR